MKKSIFLWTILGFLSLFLLLPLTASGQENEDDIYSDPHFLDMSYGTGKITGISDNGKQVNINIGIKNGLDKEKNKASLFIVQRKRIPVAILQATDIQDNGTLCRLEKIIEGITLKIDDEVLFGGKRYNEKIDNYLNKVDLKFMDNPYVDLISKSYIGLNETWNMEHLYIDIIGDAFLFTCYETSQGSGDNSIVYLFDEYGEKKWGFDSRLSIYKAFDMDFMSLLTTFSLRAKVKVSEPDYKVYGDKIYLNGCSTQLDLWVPFKYIKANGIFWAIDLRNGKEIWRVKSSEESSDQAFYSINYDNFINKICYLYGTKSICGVDVEKGTILWEFKMDGEAVDGGIFGYDKKDKFVYAVNENGYFYKLDSKDGKALWNFKADDIIVRYQRDETENIIYLFDKKKSVYTVDLEKGTLIWRYDAEKIFTSPKSNQLLGDVIYTYDESSVTLLDGKTGKPRWKCELKSPQPLYFNRVDTIYCLYDKKYLSAINIKDGRVKWSYETSEENLSVLPVKGVLYVMGTNNVYAIDMTTGKEFWRKTDFPGASYLQQIKPSIDPYNIMNLGKIENENNLFFIGGQRGYLCINPATHEIIGEKTFGEKETISRTLGDQKNFYFVSDKHLWCADNLTGQIKWERTFPGEIIFVALPIDGKVFNNKSEDEKILKLQNTVKSQSQKLVGLLSGEGKDGCYYMLNKETGDIVTQANEEENLYPYVEMEGMTKVGEQIKGVYFYCVGNNLYSFRSKK